MAKFINGVKVVKRYPFLGFIYGLLVIALAAIPVLNLFFPYFNGADPNALFGTTVNGVFSFDIKGLVIGMLVKFNLIQQTAEASIINDMNAFCTNTPTAAFGNVAQYFVIGESLLLVILAIMIIILVFMGLKIMLYGKLNNYASPMGLAIAVTILGIIYGAGGLIAQVFYAQQYLTISGVEQCKVDYMWPIIIMSSYAGGLLLIIVTYCVGFKGRVYIDNISRFENTPVKPVIEEAPKVEAPVNYTQAPVAPIIAPVAAPATPTNVVVNVPPQVAQNVQQTKLANQNQTLPSDVKSIGGHAYSQNVALRYAVIPNGIVTVGPGAFANCLSLQMVTIPTTVTNIGYNCFFNCVNLTRINYSGTKDQWAKINRGSNWLTKAKTNVITCIDGQIIVDPTK